MIYSNIIISTICSIVGIIVGIIIRKYFERKLNYDQKHDELILDNEINTLKDKLTIYWSIYFKLLICQSANMQINKINNMNRMIQLENETIIQNLDEIVEVISNNIQKMNVDENLLDLILQFITHVLAYKCLKQLNIKNRTPSEYGYPFPDQFTQEITSRTFKYQSIFEKYIGNKQEPVNPNPSLNLNLDIKEKIKKIHEQIPQNIIRSQSCDSIQFDEDDLDIICDPADIDLLAIFDNNIKNKDHIIRFNV
jgi:uncharacterized membrane-anchored protein YhcB (DUF1043 family)